MQKDLIMPHVFTAPRALLLLVSAGAFAQVACTRTADVSLVLTEPCDQTGTLASVGTLRVSYSDVAPELDAATTEGDAVSFSPDEASSLTIELDESPKILNVQIYPGDGVSGDPIALGRTMPLFIDAEGSTQVVNLGRLNSFGRVTIDTEGGTPECSDIDGGAAIPGRHGHTATYLPTIQKVLLLGGAVWVDSNAGGDRPQCFDFTVAGATVEKCFSLLKTAELFDPETGRFIPLPPPDHARAFHTATLLGDGRVLFAGGFTFIGRGDGSQALDPLPIGFIFDPAELSFDENGDLQGEPDPYSNPISFETQRAMHTATLLPGGTQVALVGGCSGSGQYCTPFGVIEDPSPTPERPEDKDPTRKLDELVEIYDAEFNTAFAVDIPVEDQPKIARTLHAASLDEDRLIISGGTNIDGPVCSVEVFVVQGDTLVYQNIADAQRLLTVCPVGHQQVTMGRGTVALIGGASEAPGGSVPEDAALISTVQFWTTIAGHVPANDIEMVGSTGRVFHSATRLNDGSVVIAGGRTSAGGATSERIVPSGATFVPEAMTTPLLEARLQGALVALPNNQAMYTGGFSPEGVTSARAEIFFGDCREDSPNPGPACVH